jgi:hypothetical protein
MALSFITVTPSFTIWQLHSQLAAAAYIHEPMNWDELGERHRVFPIPGEKPAIDLDRPELRGRGPARYPQRVRQQAVPTDGVVKLFDLPKAI